MGGARNTLRNLRQTQGEEIQLFKSKLHDWNITSSNLVILYSLAYLNLLCMFASIKVSSYVPLGGAQTVPFSQMKSSVKAEPPAPAILQILYYEEKPTFTYLLYGVTLNLCNAVNASKTSI